MRPPGDMATRPQIHEAPFNRDMVRLVRSLPLNHVDRLTTRRASRVVASITRSELAGLLNAPTTTRRPSHRRPRPRSRSRWSVVIPRRRARYTLPQIGFGRSASAPAAVVGPYITRAPRGGEHVASPAARPYFTATRRRL